MTQMLFSELTGQGQIFKDSLPSSLSLLKCSPKLSGPLLAYAPTLFLYF